MSDENIFVPMSELTEEQRELLQRRQTRTCGACDRCCIDPGIEATADPTRNSPALTKFPNVKCKFLAKTRLDSRRCSIYSHRPGGCARFKCAWLQGAFSDSMRPDKIGLMVSFYPRQGRETWRSWDDISATVFIGDSRRCGNFDSGALADTIQELTTRGCNDIRVINNQTKSVIHFYDGDINSGVLLDSDEPEALEFASFRKIGDYVVHDSKETPNAN